MVTDNDRREAARRLRNAEIESRPGSINGISLGCIGASFARIVSPSETEMIFAANCLADLIEPESERTCHLIRTRESYRGGGGVSVRCSACGKALPKRLAERWTILFCPKCGAKVVDDNAD